MSIVRIGGPWGKIRRSECVSVALEAESRVHVGRILRTLARIEQKLWHKTTTYETKTDHEMPFQHPGYPICIKNAHVVAPGRDNTVAYLLVGSNDDLSLCLGHFDWRPTAAQPVPASRDLAPSVPRPWKKAQRRYGIIQQH
jgi:hypothetical protein